MATSRELKVEKARRKMNVATKKYLASDCSREKRSLMDAIKAHARNLTRYGGKLTAYDRDVIDGKVGYDEDGNEKTTKASAAKRKRFYQSGAWRTLRYQALKKYGKRCACCGATPGNGIVLHVDHIIPRSKDSRKELDINNLQILCEDCNLGKGNADRVDHRKSDTDPRDRVIADLIKYCEELNDQIAILEMGRI